MRFGAAFWVNRTTWPALRDAAERVEAAGFDSLWADDHLLADEGDWTDPKLEGWQTLAGWSQLTARVRLGLLVGANTFRNPGLTAKLATTLDHLSDGRAILGLGGGWFEREHEAFGLDFGAGFGERLDRLDESVGLIRRLLDGERVTHEGPTYHFRDAIIAPRPVQARLPILIGGSGPRKTLLTTARYADMWNGYGDPARIADRDAILRGHCAAIGRDEAEIARTVTMDCVIRDDPRVALATYDALAERHGLKGQLGSDGTRRGLTLWGPPAIVADGIRAYEAVGVSRGHVDLPPPLRPRDDRAAGRGSGRARHVAWRSGRQHDGDLGGQEAASGGQPEVSTVSVAGGFDETGPTGPIDLGGGARWQVVSGDPRPRPQRQGDRLEANRVITEGVHASGR